MLRKSLGDSLREPYQAVLVVLFSGFCGWLGTLSLVVVPHHDYLSELFPQLQTYTEVESSESPGQECLGQE